MRVYRDFRLLPENAKGAAVALGNFDGVHIGHHSILKQTLEIAENRSVFSAVMSFYPHPRHYFAPDTPELTLTPFREKYHLLQEQGISIFFLQRFTESLATLSAEAFINDVLVEALQVSHVVIGHDFHFGHHRSGNGEYLEKMGELKGFGVSRMTAVEAANGEPYSSTGIRYMLQEGNAEEASALLGRPYTISGHVITGEQRGRLIGFPTANISLNGRLCPAHGVYQVEVRDEAGRHFYGIANIGERPTFGRITPRLEVHLFDFSGDLYGQTLTVSLLKFIRREQKFDGVDALKAQIEKDVLAVKQEIAA